MQRKMEERQIMELAATQGMASTPPMKIADDEWVEFDGSQHFNESDVAKNETQALHDKPNDAVAEKQQRKENLAEVLAKEIEAINSDSQESEPTTGANEDQSMSLPPPPLPAEEGGDEPEQKTDEEAAREKEEAENKLMPGPTERDDQMIEEGAKTMRGPGCFDQQMSQSRESLKGTGLKRESGSDKSDCSSSSEESFNADIRRMSHTVTPPRSLKKEPSHRSILLEITSPPDLMQPHLSPPAEASPPMTSRKSSRPQGFGTPPRSRDLTKSAPVGFSGIKVPESRSNSIAWFKNSRDRGVAHSLTLSEKSQRNLTKEVTTKVEEEGEEELDFDGGRETVAVFNANTEEGFLTVRALSKSGCKVVAVVRVFTSRNTKALLKLPRVSVKVSDSYDRKALSSAIEGADRAILVTKHWERFENRLEESQAMIIIDACHDVGVPHIVFSTFEDIKQLQTKGEKSQIVPGADGSIEAKFEGMREAKKKAESLDIMLTHMMTSYLDKEKSKKSLCLLSSANGKVIVRPFFKDT